nr:ATP-binding protein [Kovacikia minuta]
MVPILPEEKLWGLLVVNQCSAPRQWQPMEIDLLKQLAIQVGIAIQQSQLYQQVQLELQERNRAEEKNREQAALLDVATDAIFVRDLESHILYWNKGAERLYGWTAAEAYGRSTILLLYRQAPSNHQSIHQAVLQTGEWQGELQQITKDGKELIVESRWTLVRSSYSRSKSILVVNTDITQKKLLERQFLRSQRMESIGTLAGGIAHDVNNILAPILMSVQLLRMKLSDEQSEQWLNILESSARRGSELIKQVLSFARGMDGEQGVLQIRHLIAEIKQIAEETFPKSIQIYTHVPRELWTISGDATHLHQVLMNLCVNARDAMPDGGTLSIRARNLVIHETDVQFHLDATAGAYVAISISDTGVGIATELLDRIFEPFFTTKEMNKGTGLGLSTVMGIVKSHKGFINVSSKLGEGTEFTVFLPAVDVEETEIVDEMEVFAGQGEWILVVDDEAPIREIARNLLKTYGYKVLTASNGIEAIALYAQHQAEICLTLIDLMMPEMDGITTIHTLKKMNPDIKLITSSGLLTDTEASRTEKTCVHSFLPKPYTSNDLLQIIHDALRG